MTDDTDEAAFRLRFKWTMLDANVAGGAHNHTSRQSVFKYCGCPPAMAYTVDMTGFTGEESKFTVSAAGCEYCANPHPFVIFGTMSSTACDKCVMLNELKVVRLDIAVRRQEQERGGD